MICCWRTPSGRLSCQRFRDYVSRFGLGTDSTLLDPFCGTGTTLVEAKKLGVPSVGLEAVPVSRLAASTKVDWAPEPDELLQHAELVAEKALARLAADGISDEPTDSAPPGVRLRSLPSPSAELLTNWIRQTYIDLRGLYRFLV